ncbi:uncharacterized protein LOC111408150 [Olea europaea var. sylvestris]|uniref:uncharacterized protein LOC111408150 n=1 Tax=Olea europaea var. sylvestris TaxID=158386 RepID=UPI000C1CF240|nr:uncharacterized protein LOC111408150 [Olea europaea var. sylvestris]
MYVHCFAHQLQLAIVSVARRNCMVGDFLDVLAIIVNLVGASCKRVDALRTSYQANILEKLNTGELTGGSDVLENILEDSVHSDQKSSALRHMNNIRPFISLTEKGSGYSECDVIIEFVHILVPNMEDIVVVKGRPSRVAQQVTYFHRFYVDLYCHVIDSILQELNDRFSETTTELFTCISCLNPRDSFAAFDKDKLLRFAQFYPLDFNSEELLLLKSQLDKFLLLVRMDEAFFNLNSISCVAQKLIETRSS